MNKIRKSAIAFSVAITLLVSGSSSDEISRGYAGVRSHTERTIEAYFRARCRRIQGVRDMTEEVFLRISLKRTTFEHSLKQDATLERHFWGWTYGFARRVWLEHLKQYRLDRAFRQSRRRDEGALNADLRAAECAEEVRAVLRALPAQHAEVLVDEYSEMRPAGNSMRRCPSENAFHQRLSRARDEFRIVWLRRVAV